MVKYGRFARTINHDIKEEKMSGGRFITWLAFTLFALGAAAEDRPRYGRELGLDRGSKIARGAAAVWMRPCVTRRANAARGSPCPLVRLLLQVRCELPVEVAAAGTAEATQQRKPQARRVSKSPSFPLQLLARYARAFATSGRGSPLSAIDGFEFLPVILWQS